MILGIHESTRLIYEGDTTSNGWCVDPRPFISQISFSHNYEKALENLTHSVWAQDYKYVFREDSFEPVSRTRRGRIYKESNSKPEIWSIIPHPQQLASRGSITAEGQLQGQRLHTFHEFRLRNDYKTPKELAALNILVGIKDSFTRWTIVSVEPVMNGQEIVTLKAANSLGIVTDIDFSKIDAEDRAIVKEKYDKFLDAVPLAGPDSIVDRAGEACSALLHASLKKRHQNLTNPTLNILIEKAKEDSEFKERKLLLAASELLRLLHSRGKFSFQAKHGTRSLIHSDAQAAIESFSIVINELGLYSES